MTDPYDRLSPGTPPPKAPSYFSLLKPVKLLTWAWFWAMDATFRKGWAEAFDSYDSGPMFLAMLGIVGVGQVLPICLISGVGFGLGGWWLVTPVVSFYFIHILVYLAFHLHEEKGRQHWKDKLLS